jgi:hypothetical protein
VSRDTASLILLVILDFKLVVGDVNI